MKDIHKLRSRIGALVNQKNFEQARTELLAVHQKQQDNAEILLMLGTVDMMAGDLPASRSWLEQSNRLSPGNTMCLMQLG